MRDGGLDRNCEMVGVNTQIEGGSAEHIFGPERNSGKSANSPDLGDSTKS